MKNLFQLALLLLSFSIYSQNQVDDVLQNAIRVKFQNTIDLPQTKNSFIQNQGSLTIGKPSVDQLNAKYHATSMRRVFPYAGKFEEKHRSYGLHLWYDIFTEPGVSVEELKLQYESLQDVSIAEPISVYSHEDFKGEELNTNDPLFSDQWHYSNEGQSGGTFGADISLVNAWDEETGDSRVIVSVHDSGIDTDHPDLVNHLWINEGETPNDNIDNDNNGFVDDYYGYNFAAAVVGGDPSSVEDYGGHGTHTSGTIAAENNNGVGVAGVAGGSGTGDGVRIMMMRLGDDNGSPYIYNPAPSFIYAADMGAVISSNSWGGGGYDQSIIDAIQYFTAEAGSSNQTLDGGIVIFSSGNGDSGSQDYKSDLDHLIMVSASNHNDQKAWYSNYGTWVDITAPGGETSIQSQGVLSTLPNNTYGFYQGTSMACPHVSGVAALLVSKAYGSGLTNTQLEEALLSTTDPIDQFNPSYIGLLGTGRLNAEAALEAVSQGSGSSGELLIDPIKIIDEINESESKIFTVKIVNTNDYEIDIDISSTEYWISPNAANLSLAPNGVGKFTVEVNSSSAGDLLEGQITFSYLSFNSNVTSILPVSIYTLGEASISSIDTLNFGTRYIGYPTTQIVEIINDGTNYLTISEAENFTSDYEFDFSDTTLSPSASIVIPIKFTPSQSGALIDSILFASNDSNQPTYKVVLSGEGNTLSPPQLGLNPEEINIQLPSAISGTGYFIVTNEGDETLSYSVTSNPADIVPLEDYSDNYVNIENEQPVQNNGNYNGVGNLVSHQKNPVSLEQGLGWDGEYLWIKESANSTIYRYDVDSQIAIDSIESIATSTSRLDFYDGFLWEHDWNNQIIQYDLSGAIIAQIDLPEQYYFTQGIAVDQDGIWLNSGSEFILLNYEGETEDEFTNYDAYGLEAIETIGSKIYGLRNGRIIVFTKFSIRDDFYSSYIGGYYQLNTSDIALGGESAWTSFIDYGVLVEFEPFENFINYSYPSSGNVSPGESVNVNFEYNINSFIDGLNYNDVFRIYSNDLDNPTVDLPVSLLITGSPQINVSETQISFDSYVGYEAIDTITIRNDGAAPLLVSSVTSSLPDFIFSFTEIELGQFESFDLPISISMTNTDTLEAILQIVSNDADPEEDTINVSLSAIGRLAPEISIQPDSLFITLYENQTDSLPITITNSGDGDLFYSIINEPINESISSILSTSETFSDGFVLDSKDDVVPRESMSFYSSESIPTDPRSDSFDQVNYTEIEDILASLDTNNEIITSVLDSRYSFYDGEYGSSISDGGNDMYDGGNRLSTDLGGYINYTNSNIYANQNFLGGGTYFTAKYDGLFVLSADLKEVNTFSINGNLGADGGGSVDGSVLSFNYRGIEWLGFVKRVYNAYDPSVNHLIIVPNNNAVNHSFATNTNDDMHQLNDLTDIGRLHYLLFAGQNGHYYSDESILALMETFIVSVEEGSYSEPVAPNTSIEEHIIFEAQGLDPSTYEYDIKVNSNDPVSRRINIPTSLTVNSRPILSMNVEQAVYDTAFVGSESFVNILLQNLGSDTLMITDIVLNGSENIILGDYVPDTLASNYSDYITLILHPTAIESFSSTLSFQTTDPLNSMVEIQINGYGKSSSILSLDPYLTTDTLVINGSGEYPINITNNGTQPLDYRIVVEETYPNSFFIDQIETIWRKSGILNGSVTFPSYQMNDGTVVPSQTVSSREQIAAYKISSGANRVLLLGSENSTSNGLEILNELQSVGDFGFISYINANYYSISYDLLKNYDAVLVWNYSGYNDANSLGDALAEYVDNGGGVVTALYENVLRELGGLWSSDYEKYSLFNSQDFNSRYGYDNAFITSQGSHDLFNNVDTLKSGTYGLRVYTSSEHVSSDAEIVAIWNDGTPAVIASTLSEIRRVDLGFYPGSNAIRNDSWDFSSDGSQLIVNAIRYVSNGITGSEVNWVEASSYQESDQLPGESREISFSVNTEGLSEGIVGARASLYSNDSRNEVIPAYFSITIDGTSDLLVSDSINFEETTLEFAKTRKLFITNQGDGQAQFTISLDSLSKFSLDYNNGDTLTIGAFDRINLNVHMNADSIGSFSDVIFISNISDPKEYEVNLFGNVVPPGSIRIQPSSIDLIVDYQDETTSSFTIFNEGEGDLNFLMPAFYSRNEAESLNDTQFIEFSNTINKGQKDDRKGHPIISGKGFDSFGYSYVDTAEPESPSYSWNDITESGTQMTLEDDDIEQIYLEFEFPFYGLRKSSVFVSSNGLLSFLEAGSTSPINKQFPNSSSPNGVVAPFWKDLSPNNGGTIHYLSGADKLIIQYTDIPDYQASGTFTFQAILYRTGDIIFLYESMGGKLNDASIGLENDFGSNGLQIAFNTEYISNMMGVYISYPQPQINPEVTTGSIISGDSLIIPFTYNSLEDIGGNYSQELAISSNDTSSSISIIDINVEVIAPTLISAYRDTVVFDTTFINRVAQENIWFYNDSIGVLSINEVISSNAQFNVLFPEYEARIGTDTTEYYVDLIFDANTERLYGSVYGLEGEILSAKIYSKIEDQIEVVTDLSTNKISEGHYSINQLISLAELDKWNLANTSLFVDFNTSNDTPEKEGISLLPREHRTDPKSYTRPFQSLYRPAGSTDDTTEFSVISNAINSDEVIIHGFGTGISSDASINVSISSIDAVLNVTDSTQQMFTISNTGTDTLYVGLSVNNYNFKSNKNANRVSASSKTSRSKLSEFLVPAFTSNIEQEISETDYSILSTQTLSEYYGLLYENGDGILSRINFNEITPLVNVEDFASASEFLHGTDQQLINLNPNGELFVIDIVTSEIVTVGQIQGNIWTGLTTSEDSNILYACDIDNLYSINLTTFEAELIGRFNASNSMLGIAMNNLGELFGYGFDDNFYSIDKLTGNATRVGYVGFDVGPYFQDLAYDYNNDQFIMAAINNSASYRTEVRRVNTSTGNTEILSIIEKENINYQLGSIAFKNDSDSRMVKLDSNRYAIAPNQSTNVSVNLYANNMNNGLHTSNITIRSNDYSNPTIEVPISLEITGNNPIIGAYTESINFGLHTVESTVIDSAFIENKGKEVLILSLESISDPFSSIFNIGDTLKIDINDQVSFPIIFNPEDADVIDSQMLWSSNDPDLPELSIHLSGAGERASRELNIDFESYETQMPRFNEKVIPFSLSSVGEDSVQFSMKPLAHTDWLTIDSIDMVLPPDSTFATSFSINTHNITIGSYESLILLSSDDPFYDSLIIPIKLDVYNLSIESISEITPGPIAIGEENLKIVLNDYFDDGDSDSLIYNVGSKNESIGVAFDADTLLLTAVAYGLDTINISAMDQFGDTLSIDFELMANTRPTAKSIDSQSSRMDQSIVVLFSLNEYFLDADGNVLSYQIEQDEVIADLIIDSDDNLIMKPEIVGTTTVSVTAFDGFHYHSEIFELTVGKPLGLQDEIQATFQLYPVPASDIITVSFETNERGSYEFKIIDLSGKIKSHQVIENSSGLIEEHIDIDKLQSGYYILQILISDKLMLTKDFIKK